MSMLKHTWESAGEVAKRDLQQQRLTLNAQLEQLKLLRDENGRSTAQGSELGKERVTLDGELKAQLLQIEKLDGLLKGEDDSVQADAWHVYREAVLKLERMSARVKEFVEKVKEAIVAMSRESKASAGSGFAGVAGSLSLSRSSLAGGVLGGRNSKMGSVLRREITRRTSTGGDSQAASGLAPRRSCEREFVDPGGASLDEQLEGDA